MAVFAADLAVEKAGEEKTAKRATARSLKHN